MRFLLKLAFWLTIVVHMLPADPPQSAASKRTEARVSAPAAPVADLADFCSRQAQVCVTGAQAAKVLGQTAQAGIKLLYDYLTDRAEADTTGSIGAPQKKAAETPSQDTLTPADIAPAWRGPQPRNEKARRPA